jgi:hypothetical protein
MTYRRLVLPVVAAASLLGSAVVMAPAAGAASGSLGVTRQISAAGSTSYSATPAGTLSGVQSNELAPAVGGDVAGPSTSTNAPSIDRSSSNAHDSNGESGQSRNDEGAGGGSAHLAASFDGLNHRQQRLANGGNQFSLEPPDQGLCAGNGKVMEIINDVMRVYSPTGAPLTGVEDLNTFFGYAPAIIRATNTTPAVFGPFVTDPSCYYDKATNRWFADVLTLDTDSATGHFLGSNHLDIAVSKTADPTGAWTIYRLPVQDDGSSGTPNHGCSLGPCLGDYPHLGADAYGIYLTTNEYSFFGPEFHGAQVYAFSKSALASGASSINVTQFDTHGMDRGNSGFTIWPATAANGLNSYANRGTEFFLSSNAADEAHGDGVAVGPRHSNQLLVWSLTNTRSLNSNHPDAELSHSVLGVGEYAVPSGSTQKAGSTPLVDCLNTPACSTAHLLGGPDPFTESEYKLDSNDTRMQQVVYANGNLWAALDTAVGSGSESRAGIEWFVVRPSGEDGATLVNDGYFAPEGKNVIYPAVGVLPNGQGVMAFTLTGPNDFPSAAFTTINADGTGRVQIAQAGAGPADGFSGTFAYNYPNPPRPRWGDYGAAVVDGNNIWIASEYIGQTCTLAQYEATPFGSCGGTRTTLANWDTRISEVTPGGE